MNQLSCGSGPAQAPASAAAAASGRILGESAIPDGNLRRVAQVPECMGRHVAPGPAKARSPAVALPALACAALLSACDRPPETRHLPDSAAVERGLAAIDRVGCGACHEIPGLDWPRGRTGPSLVGFGDIGLIAGALPNTPANLAEFVRDAPSAKPGSTMPAMPLTPAEARDVASYLQGMHDA